MKRTGPSPSIILRTGARLLMAPLLLLSLVILFQGHNEPGGGFVGGLVAAAAVALYSMAFGTQPARKLVRFELFHIIGIGLLLAVGSGVFGLVVEGAFLKGIWTSFDIAGLGTLKISNITTFDIGVYMTVVGVILTFIFSLEEASEVGVMPRSVPNMKPKQEGTSA
ncbi:MAG: MnhB domain-containing protein [Planctomycetota bacterium]